jgi:PPK2 family polyphosphate:nucleotide phosphotransferase
MTGAESPNSMASILQAVHSPWKVPGDGSLSEPPQNYVAPPGTQDCKHKLQETRKAIRPYQRKLYAGKQYSVLLIFQALDAAGNNVQVAAFKRPTERELRHDFLWRTSRQLPERGEIGIFNRSYYEEVLTVRVHPEFLGGQYAGSPPDPETLWPERYNAIREHERHLATAHTLVLKFWLNVSPATQARRFLDRLDTPEKRWKFSMGDIRESMFRAEYDEAVRHMLNETSRPWAPWFCIPADDRWYLRWQVADIVKQAMAALPLRYPQAEEIPEEKAAELRELLNARIKD